MKDVRATSLRSVALLAIAVGALACSTDTGVIVPPHSELAISLSTTMRSDRVTPGVKLRGALEKPVVIDDEVVLEPGHPVTLEVVESHPAEGDAPARVSLILTRIGLPSGRTDVETHPLEIVGRPQRTSGAEKIAAGAVGGALLGGIVEGGKGAAIGGALGAAAGGVVAVTTKGDTIVLPAGRKLTFVTSESMEIPRSSR